MKPDDSSVSVENARQLQRHARLALEKASAFGRFPTPVADVMEAAKLIVAEEGELNEGLLQKVRTGALRFGKALKSALSKVLGVLDVGARIVYIDKGVHVIKRVFIKLHEAGHSLLPWQRELYCAIEDCEKTLSPDISEAFDREANCFASEVLFQLETFRDEAAGYAFGLNVPLKLSKKYGASVYSTIRRYVSTHHRCCLVLVLDPPAFAPGDGFTCALRRVLQSDSFKLVFGELRWPDPITPDIELGRIVPLGSRKMSRPARLRLADQNGVTHECIAESFKHNYQIFILIHETEALTRTTVVRP